MDGKQSADTKRPSRSNSPSLIKEPGEAGTTPQVKVHDLADNTQLWSDSTENTSGVQANSKESLQITDGSQRRTRSNSGSVSADFLVRKLSQTERLQALTRILERITSHEGVIGAMVLDSWENSATTIMTNFRQDHSQLVTFCPSVMVDDDYFTQGTLSQMENVMFDILTALADLKDKLPPVVPPANSTESRDTSHGAKLPEIKLPSFSGSYAEWPEFKASFSDLVLTSSRLGASQKVHYLRSSLSGESLALINSFPITAEGLDLAWNTLLTRYENERYLITEHIGKLNRLSHVQPKSSASLNSMISSLSGIRKSLMTHVSREELGDCLLTAKGISLLDRLSVEQWETSLANSSEFPSFENLEQFLMGRVRALEQVEGASHGSVNQSGGKSQGTHQSTKAMKAHFGSSGPSHSAADSRKTQPAKQYPCSFCDGSHFIVFCPGFKELSLTARRHFVVEKVLCYNCLGKHAARNCNSKVRCKTCGQSHHTMIHPESGANPGASTQTKANSSTQ